MWMLKYALIGMIGLALAAQTALSLAAEPATSGKSTDVCQIIAMRLVVQQKEARPSEVLSMDKSGKVQVAFSSDMVIRLDPRGCLTGPDGVWVDQTRRGVLWTIRQEIPIVECGLNLGNRILNIAADGTVKSSDELATPDPAADYTLRFEGFEPSGCCAARILLATYLSMMPSMAVSDGHPLELPPPKDSACSELHKGKSR